MVDLVADAPDILFDEGRIERCDSGPSCGREAGLAGVLVLGVCQEREANALGLDDGRPTSLLEIAAAPRASDPRLLECRQGVEQALALGVEHVVVGRRDDVDTAQLESLHERRRGHEGADAIGIVRERRLEVQKGDVGLAEDRRDLEKGIARPLLVGGEREVMQAEVLVGGRDVLVGCAVAALEGGCHSSQELPTVLAHRFELLGRDESWNRPPAAVVERRTAVVEEDRAAVAEVVTRPLDVARGDQRQPVRRPRLSLDPHRPRHQQKQ